MNVYDFLVLEYLNICISYVYWFYFWCIDGLHPSLGYRIHISYWVVQSSDNRSYIRTLPIEHGFWWWRFIRRFLSGLYASLKSCKYATLSAPCFYAASRELPDRSSSNVYAKYGITLLYGQNMHSRLQSPFHQYVRRYERWVFLSQCGHQDKDNPWFRQIPRSQQTGLQEKRMCEASQQLINK